MRKGKFIIKETRGIAESAIPYSNAILSKLDKHIEYFFEQLTPEYLESVKDLRRDGYLPSSDYSNSFVIPYRTLATYIDNDIFEDFPIVEIRCDINCAYVDKENEHEDQYSISGGAWPIYRGYLGKTPMSQRVKPEKFPVSKIRRESVDRAIIAEVEFDLTFYKGFIKENDMEVFYRELKAVVFHEMMHIYEGYKNKSLDQTVLYKSGLETKRPKSKAQTTKAYLADTKLIGTPTQLNEAMGVILNHYYNALPAEVKAITHEMYPYVMDLSVDEFFNTYQGRRAKGLMEFDGEDFYDGLVVIVEDYFEEKGIPFNKETMEGYFNQIKMRIQKKYKETSIKHNIEIDERFLKQKTLKDLINYMSRDINRAGQRLFKNVGRLYSLKND